MDDQLDAIRYGLTALAKTKKPLFWEYCKCSSVTESSVVTESLVVPRILNHDRLIQVHLSNSDTKGTWIQDLNLSKVLLTYM